MMTEKAREPSVVSFDIEVLDRMELALLQVQERLSRSTSAIEAAGVAYALGGSNATALWIATVDTAAVRHARNVEIVMLRSDIDLARSVLEAVGFVSQVYGKGQRFLDGPNGAIRDSLDITFGKEPVVGPSPTEIAPDPTESQTLDNVRVLHLYRLVSFQLARYRLDDAVDLRDMIEVGLIDATWPAKFKPELAARLQHLLDTPDG